MIGEYPQLIRGYDGYWGSSTADPHGHMEMCECAAEKFHAGITDLIAFEVMAFEVPLITEYMRDRHPLVKFCFGSANQVLNSARSNWRKANEQGNAGVSV